MLDKDLLKSVGIDYKKGLTYFGQNEALYEKYLMDFAREKFIGNAIEQLEQKNIQGAFQSVHSLKSLVEYVSIPIIDGIVHEVTESLRAGKTEGVMDGLLFVKSAAQDIKKAILEENK